MTKITNKFNKEKTFFIFNFGCQMNESDAEHFAGQLVSFGYTESDTPQNADVILFNTCCVRDSAEKKILGKIGEIKHIKKKNPGLIVIIAGCMAQKEGSNLIKTYPYIDCILGTHYINSLSEIMPQLLAGERVVLTEQHKNTADEFSGDSVRKSGISAWIPIMYGCNNFCTYCIVPHVRGRERSRSQADIIAEVRDAVSKGFKEFTLLGQNVNSYGREFDGSDNFAALLEAVDGINGVERIRYMTSHPRDMNETVIKTVAQSKHICEHFHLPLQAGSDRILKMMNRGYTSADYLRLVELVRKHVQHATLSTDLIVGFPGETEADFTDTLNTVRQADYDAAYTFLYSKRTGTPASEYPDQVEKSVKKERFDRLLAMQNEISLRKNKLYIEKTVQVMYEGSSKTEQNVLTGRTRGNKIVLWENSGDQLAIGDLVNVQIKQAQTWLLKGDIIC